MNKSETPDLSTAPTIDINVTELKEQADIDKIFSEVESIAQKNNKVNVVLTLNNREDATNFRHLFSNIRHRWAILRKIRKCAVITDNEWIENLSETVGYLTPWLHIKAFDKAEKGEAIEWANSAKENEKHGLAIWPKDNYLHLIVYDKLTLVDFKALNKVMHSYESEVSLLIEFSDYDGITLRALLEDLKLGFSHFRKFKKMALVVDKNVKSISGATNILTPGISCKAFPGRKLNEAANWLNQ